MSDDLLVVEPDEAKNDKTMGALRALSADLQQKGIRSALHKGGLPLVKAMRSLAPDDRTTSGSHLQQAINKTNVKSGDGLLTGQGRRFADIGKDEIALVIGPNKKIGGISVHGTASITEWGAKPHTIMPKHGVLNIAGRFFTGSIHHPGVTGTGWMARTLDMAGNRYYEQFYHGLERFMDKYGH